MRKRAITGKPDTKKGIRKMNKMFKKPRTLYSSSDVQRLLNLYMDKGGRYIELEEGCLGWGKIIMFGEKLKTAVVTEVYINSWSSGHSVVMYNKTPKKHLSAIYE